MRLIIAISFLISSAVAAQGITNTEYEKFMTLTDVDFEHSLIKVNGRLAGKSVQATNYSEEDVCITSNLTETKNVQNRFVNFGKAIVPAGATVNLGSFAQFFLNKHWYATWRHAVHKNLDLCK